LTDRGKEPWDTLQFAHPHGVLLALHRHARIKRVNDGGKTMTVRCTVATGIAVLCATTLGLAQTTPSGQQRQTGQKDDQRTVTVVGCLQEEKDVHGQRPNVAERAGVGEDFILTQASLKGSGSSGSGSSATGTPRTSGTAGTPGTTGTGSTATGGSSATGSPGMAGSHSMYKVKGLDDEKLRPLLNKRVEVMGKIDMKSDRSGSGATGTGTNRTGTTGTGREPEDRSGTGSPGTKGTGGTGSAMRDASKTDQHEMPELRATSIKEVAGSCQSTQ